jgi:hypothetical protein
MSELTRGHSGVVYEPHDARTEQYQACELIGQDLASPVMPLADHLWPILDQGLSESCVGMAIAQAVYVRQGAMGIRQDRRVMPAPTDIYYRARASRNGWQNVIDIGSNPVAGWECLRDPMGIVDIQTMPFNAMDVDDPPDPAAYRRAIERRWLEYHWILDDGQDRLVTLDALLRTGHPVTCALTVDRALTRWTPGQGPWRYRGPGLGGHYVCLTSVDIDGNYWGPGSWGRNYGAGGTHCIARDEIASVRVSYLATPVIDIGKVGK